MEIRTYTDKEILSLIPAQMLLDSDRARLVIEGVAQAEQKNTLRQVLLLLSSHYFGSLPGGSDVFKFTQKELWELKDQVAK